MERRAPRLPVVALLLALASCQASRGDAGAVDGLRAELDAENRAMRAEIEELRGLVVQSMVARPAAPADQANGVLRVVVEGAAPGAPVGLAGPASALAAREAAARVDADDPTIEALVRGLDAIEQQRAVLCENIANEGVHGYKRRELATVLRPIAGTDSTAPAPAGMRTSMTQGVLEATGNALDIGIEGQGFFEVQLPNGELRYTRNGTFRQHFNGRLVTAEGYLLTDAIAVPEDSHGVMIGSNGQVFSLEEGNLQTALGTVSLRVFPYPSRLGATGTNHFVPTVASGQAVAMQPGTQDAGMLRQGYVERSNVELRKELIEIQRLDLRARTIQRLLAERGIFTP